MTENLPVLEIPIICGWYTPDYKPYRDKLVRSIEEIGLPHHFFPAPALNDHWENITRLKSKYILQAMDEFPARTILFLDADCEITGTRGELLEACDIPGDIGFYLRTRFNRHKKVRCRPRSGTLVIRPTGLARKFIEAWDEISSSEAPGLQVDEASLLVTMGRVPGVSITVLPQEMTAIRFDKLERPIIFHASASADLELHASWFTRLRQGYFGWRNWFPAEM